MPQMQGTEFMKILSEKYPDIIKILLTGFSDTDTIVDAINDCHLYQYILKPVDPETLTVAVDTGIEKYDFSKQSLYKKLEEEYGVKIKRAYRTLEAVLANNEVGDLLQIHPGAPLILFKCVTVGEINDKEIPIETFNSYYRTDIFKFSIEQIR